MLRYCWLPRSWRSSPFFSYTDVELLSFSCSKACGIRLDDAHPFLGSTVPVFLPSPATENAHQPVPGQRTRKAVEPTHPPWDRLAIQPTRVASKHPAIVVRRPLHRFRILLRLRLPRHNFCTVLWVSWRNRSIDNRFSVKFKTLVKVDAVLSVSSFFSPNFSRRSSTRPLVQQACPAPNPVPGIGNGHGPSSPTPTSHRTSAGLRLDPRVLLFVDSPYSKTGRDVAVWLVANRIR